MTNKFHLNEKVFFRADQEINPYLASIVGVYQELNEKGLISIRYKIRYKHSSNDIITIGAIQDDLIAEEDVVILTIQDIKDKFKLGEEKEIIILNEKKYNT